MRTGAFLLGKPKEEHLKKGKNLRRMVSALLAVLLCMSCLCSPMVFAAEMNSPAEVENPTSTEEQLTEESAEKDEATEPTATPQPTAEPDAEPTLSEAAQDFIDAVAAIDRETVLITANAWGLAHLAWVEDQANPELQAALDEATAASDEAAVQLLCPSRFRGQ